MDIVVGTVADVPEDRCTAIADGAAIVVRVGEDVVAFPNRCLHQDSPLAEGMVFNGRLTCPLHFWRYDLPSGEHVGGMGALDRYPVAIGTDGRVVVTVPDPQPIMSVRERMLQHAREWDRGDAR
jgi:nitrite reductase/ring-hydroxylating ferredoxin subunit